MIPRGVVHADCTMPFFANVTTPLNPRLDPLQDQNDSYPCNSLAIPKASLLDDNWERGTLCSCTQSMSIS